MVMFVYFKSGSACRRGCKGSCPKLARHRCRSERRLSVRPKEIFSIVALLKAG